MICGKEDMNSIIIAMQKAIDSVEGSVKFIAVGANLLPPPKFEYESPKQEIVPEISPPAKRQRPDLPFQS